MIIMRPPQRPTICHLGNPPVTLWVSAQGAQATDCRAGSSTCPAQGNIASQTWSSRTAQGIQNRQVWHFFAIDYWATWLQSTMTIPTFECSVRTTFSNNAQ